MFTRTNGDNNKMVEKTNYSFYLPNVSLSIEKLLQEIILNSITENEIQHHWNLNNNVESEIKICEKCYCPNFRCTSRTFLYI